MERTPSRRCSIAARSAPVVSTAAAQAQIAQPGSSAAVSRSSASDRANVRRPGSVSAGTDSGRSACASRRGSSSGPSAPNVASPTARSPSAAVETSSERPV